MHVVAVQPAVHLVRELMPTWVCLQAAVLEIDWRPAPPGYWGGRIARVIWWEYSGDGFGGGSADGGGIVRVPLPTRDLVACRAQSTQRGKHARFAAAREAACVCCRLAYMYE
jgi:hypothetical protein